MKKFFFPDDDATIDAETLDEAMAQLRARHAKENGGEIPGDAVESKPRKKRPSSQ